jgi:oxygen-independent coproporphyrinogen-3 oxidase
MQVDCQELLATRGYEQYEVSAYARAGRRSRHNLNYWRFGDYIGIGAGAHGKLTQLSGAGGIERTTRVKQPREYLSRAADQRVSERRRVPVEDVPFEFMLNGLRLIEGFDEQEFESRTGLAFAVLSANTTEAERKGLLASDAPHHWRATPTGQRFLNDLQALFLPDPGAGQDAPMPGA